MKTPIIVIESDDIGVYRSPEHTLSNLEYWDIKDKIYSVYDSEGFLLDFKTGFEKKERKFLWLKWMAKVEKMYLRKHEPAVNYSEELREKLLSYLTKEGENSESLQKASLWTLTEIVGKYMPRKI